MDTNGENASINISEQIALALEQQMRDTRLQIEGDLKRQLELIEIVHGVVLFAASGLYIVYKKTGEDPNEILNDYFELIAKTFQMIIDKEAADTKD